jgi:hypothetical protein
MVLIFLFHIIYLYIATATCNTQSRSYTVQLHSYCRLGTTVNTATLYYIATIGTIAAISGFYSYYGFWLLLVLATIATSYRYKVVQLPQLATIATMGAIRYTWVRLKYDARMQCYFYSRNIWVISINSIQSNSNPNSIDSIYCVNSIDMTACVHTLDFAGLYHCMQKLLANSVLQPLLTSPIDMSFSDIRDEALFNWYSWCSAQAAGRGTAGPWTMEQCSAPTWSIPSTL